MKAKDLIICRCEEVSYEEILTAVEEGAQTAQELKMKTRAGMGVCQGRICRSLLEKHSNTKSCEIEDHPSMLTYHHPIRPVHLAQIKEIKEV